MFGVSLKTHFNTFVIHSAKQHQRDVEGLESQPKAGVSDNPPPSLDLVLTLRPETDQCQVLQSVTRDASTPVFIKQLPPPLYVGRGLTPSSLLVVLPPARTRLLYKCNMSLLVKNTSFKCLSKYNCCRCEVQAT